jgi:hypothetical protein
MNDVTAITLEIIDEMKECREIEQQLKKEMQINWAATIDSILPLIPIGYCYIMFEMDAIQ